MWIPVVAEMCVCVPLVCRYSWVMCSVCRYVPLGVCPYVCCCCVCVWICVALEVCDCVPAFQCVLG